MSVQVLSNNTTTTRQPHLPSNLSCITCKESFTSANIHRAHYKSDFHRFNIKRKIVGLPVVTFDIFTQKLNELQNATNDQKTQALHCTDCGKKFNTDQTYQQHLTSKKHLANKKGTPKPVRVPHKPNTEESLTSNNDNPASSETSKPEHEMNDEEWAEHKIKTSRKLKLEECLFCNTVSNDLTQNVEHMTNEHGFFLPDYEYLVDLEGLITYLGEKISIANICIYCGGKGRAFSSIHAARSHMVEKAHCKFYYEDTNSSEYADFYDFSSTHLTEEKKPFELAENGLELVVGNKILGHRSLHIYYKQRAHEKRLICRDIQEEHKRLQQIEEHKAKRLKKQDYYKIQKHYMQLGVKANNLQKHFRADCPL